LSALSVLLAPVTGLMLATSTVSEVSIPDSTRAAEQPSARVIYPQAESTVSEVSMQPAEAPDRGVTNREAQGERTSMFQAPAQVDDTRGAGASDRKAQGVTNREAQGERTSMFEPAAR
jgi:hypothetical protein